VLYDEHTWGASNSISEPDDSLVIGQWKIKQRFATEADTLSRRLLDKALSPLSEAPLPGRVKKPIETSIGIYNTNSWGAPTSFSFHPRKVLPEIGSSMNAGVRSPLTALHRELAVLAESIPPMSSDAASSGAERRLRDAELSVCEFSE